MITNGTSGSSLNDTPSGERVHIAFFGLRNAGKSSLVNAVTGQELSVVSEVKGTTTDPVKKAMELLPLGPVLIIDTPGLDDEGTLGEKRVKRAKEILAQCDIAVLVHDSLSELADSERELMNLFESRKLPYIIVNNKADLLQNHKGEGFFVSALTGENINALKEKIASLAKNNKPEKRLIADKLTPGDLVILVIPVDKAAPKGRLILPQQQTIRDILDSGCIASVCQDSRLSDTLKALNVKPKIVITDSQVFGKVNKLVPSDILLTSFSILFARYKGDLKTLVQGAKTLSQVKDGDKILISEGCTHHRQCGDIGRDKIPEWVRNFSGSSPEFEFTSGNTFPEADELRKYSLIIHCGGCMLNEQEMKSRIERAEIANVPIVNYGLAIAHMHGILTRSLEPFADEL
ncbi:MAG: [Synergistaceae bacterium]|nr:[FeFe] hydrogenase H-cluster maturation GTPase HydF [Synergistaceae bacterium]